MLKVKLLSPTAKAPTIAHPGEDLGYDLFASESVTLAPRGNAVVPTGIAIELTTATGEPLGALLRDKSSMAARRCSAPRSCSGGREGQDAAAEPPHRPRLLDDVELAGVVAGAAVAAVVVDGPVPCARVGWRFLFQPPTSAHRVVSIEGLDRLAELPGVNSVSVNRSPGDTIDWRQGTRHYIYSVFGVAADYDELLGINRFLHEEVSIVYE